MSGNQAGALKFKAKMLAKDPNYFKRLGQKGGKASSGYKFGHGKVDPRVIGALGGRKSRKTKVSK